MKRVFGAIVVLLLLSMHQSRVTCSNLTRSEIQSQTMNFTESVTTVQNWTVPLLNNFTSNTTAYFLFDFSQVIISQPGICLDFLVVALTPANTLLETFYKETRCGMYSSFQFYRNLSPCEYQTSLEQSALLSPSSAITIQVSIGPSKAFPVSPDLSYDVQLVNSVQYVTTLIAMNSQIQDSVSQFRSSDKYYSSVVPAQHNTVIFTLSNCSDSFHLTSFAPYSLATVGYQFCPSVSYFNSSQFLPPFFNDTLNSLSWLLTDVSSGPIYFYLQISHEENSNFTCSVAISSPAPAHTSHVNTGLVIGLSVSFGFVLIVAILILGYFYYRAHPDYDSV